MKIGIWKKEILKRKTVLRRVIFLLVFVLILLQLMFDNKDSVGVQLGCNRYASEKKIQQPLFLFSTILLEIARQQITSEVFKIPITEYFVEKR